MLANDYSKTISSLATSKAFYNCWGNAEAIHQINFERYSACPPSVPSCADTGRGINRIVQGWSNHFHYGNGSVVFHRIQRWVQDRFRIWLWKKYDKTLCRYTFFTNDRLHGQYQLWKMPTTVPWTR